VLLVMTPLDTPGLDGRPMAEKKELNRLMSEADREQLTPIRTDILELILGELRTRNAKASNR
jgi:hypothetical protein